MITDKLKKALEKALSEVGLHVSLEEIHLEHPAVETYGDYSSNIAMATFDKLQTPRERAAKIVDTLLANKELSDIVLKIDVAGPGFINFRLSDSALLSELKKIKEKENDYGRSTLFQNKKYLIEHTSPNTIKTLHVGHVRNNVLGMAMDRILEYCGASVSLDAINNDRGIHVMKANWAYLQYGKKGEREDNTAIPAHWKKRLGQWKVNLEDWKSPDGKGDVFVDEYYVLGAKAEAEIPDAKEQMQEMLRAWEAGDQDVRALWKTLRDWTFVGFKQTYKRLGSHHDQQWFESDFYMHGKETVQEGLKKGVFKKLADGAVLSDLEKYKLPNTIVLRSDGTSMYHTQDLYLMQLKREKFPSDLYIWDIGPEQILYLQQLFAMCEQLGIGKRSDYFHLSYGFVYLKGQGKMSSRKGNVVAADWLMDETVMRAKKIIETSETGRSFSDQEKQAISEAVGIGAIKFGFLKVGRSSDIHFDIDESVSLEGDSGPYVQYTYARCRSVLENGKWKMESGKKNLQLTTNNLQLNAEELSVLRFIYRFPEAVTDAAKTYSPNLLCTFLFELAQRYNTFYHEHSILKPKVADSLQTTDYRLPTTNYSKQAVDRRLNAVVESSDRRQSTVDDVRNFRLLLTEAVSIVLQNGLYLLGIEAPEKM